MLSLRRFFHCKYAAYSHSCSPEAKGPLSETEPGTAGSEMQSESCAEMEEAERARSRHSGHPMTSMLLGGHSLEFVLRASRHSASSTSHAGSVRNLRQACALDAASQ